MVEYMDRTPERKRRLMSFFQNGADNKQIKKSKPRKPRMENKRRVSITTTKTRN